MATTIRARIYARGKVSFAKLVCQTVGDQFFLFCQNYMDAKLVCQIVGVALISVVHSIDRTSKYYQLKNMLAIA
jgi:hypothetical protein